MDDDLTHDAFLGGRLHLWQPRRGYRAGVDPVLLAASVPARAGQSVLDLGCGAGAAALCLGARVPGLVLTGVERQADYAQLAARNGLDVVTADLADLPEPIKQQSFDHVLANPPYFDRSAGREAADLGREGALGIDTPLLDWVDVAARRLKPKGYMHMIHRAERVPDLLAATQPRLGSIELWPICPRRGKAAELVILRARKDGRAPFCLHAPVILHAAPRHERDGDDYTAEIQAVLRDGVSLFS
ncbi:methyltransferase [uncultured Tateyamaria sp.]|uniref:tRNA1(Val) (adenine(37)-N6)-methyltransferase n=1 Tax=Tateyamaria sp. 1078 TaxID=3417464 RepID=UPI00262EF504|nr:methyltransferase [uncultured Tateyamaria sp.]